MTNRLTLFKWRAVARRLATDPDLPSESLATAIRLRMCLDALSLPHDDRCIEPPNLGRGLLFHAWLLIKSKPINLRPLSLLDMTDPAKVAEPEWRVQALVNLFNGLTAGTYIVTPQIQQAFRRAADSDPDPRVRAWALFLIDPDNHPRPDGE